MISSSDTLLHSSFHLSLSGILTVARREIIFLGTVYVHQLALLSCKVLEDGSVFNGQLRAINLIKKSLLLGADMAAFWKTVAMERNKLICSSSLHTHPFPLLGCFQVILLCCNFLGSNVKNERRTS